METKDLIIYTKEYPAREAVYSDFPENMLPELAAYLESRGIRRLYCHQAEMFEKAQEGKNLVITTSTASGKTLSFLLPVIQEILKIPRPEPFSFILQKRWQRISTGRFCRWWNILGKTG